MLVSELCDRYLREYASSKKSAAGDAHLIAKHIKPTLGALTVQRVRYANITTLHTRLKRTPYQANRVLSLLSILFELAEKWELRDKGTNPCRQMKRYRESRRIRYLTEDELKRIVEALEAKFVDRPLEAGLLLLLLYTGARKGEIVSLMWDDIYADEIRLPDSKTGQRSIFLIPQAVGVLNRLPRNHARVVGDVNVRYVWAAVLQECGIKDLRIHDLRHSFASVGVSAKLSMPQIGGLLGHSSPATTARYAHLLPSEGRAAAMAISRELERMTA